MKTILLVVLAINLQAISKHCIKDHAANFTYYPSTIEGIIGIESTYCKYKVGDDGKSLGCGQVQVSTAKFLATKDDSLAWLLELPDAIIKNLLIKNDALNIEITAKYFEYNRKRVGYKGAVIQHNGLWEVNSKGKAVRDKNGNKIPNIKYYNKVKREMDRNLKR